MLLVGWMDIDPLWLSAIKRPDCKADAATLRQDRISIGNKIYALSTSFTGLIFSLFLLRHLINS